MALTARAQGRGNRKGGGKEEKWAKFFNHINWKTSTIRKNGRSKAAAAAASQKFQETSGKKNIFLNDFWKKKNFWL